MMRCPICFEEQNITTTNIHNIQITNSDITHSTIALERPSASSDNNISNGIDNISDVIDVIDGEDHHITSSIATNSTVDALVGVDIAVDNSIIGIGDGDGDGHNVDVGIDDVLQQAKGTVLSCCYECDKHVEWNPCVPCLQRYVSYTIDTSMMGVCPAIYCPCPHEEQETREGRDNKSKKTKVLMDYECWSDVERNHGMVTREVINRYTMLAENVLSFLCSYCHRRGSLLVSCHVKGSIEYANAIQSVENFIRLHHIASEQQSQTEVQINENIISQFHHQLTRYCHGRITTEGFYQSLCNDFISDFTLLSDQQAWVAMSNILSIIINPERRANLQLYHYHKRPRIWTRCCLREHCYQCQTTGYHENRSCAANQSTLDNSIGNCPDCGIPMIKGDGCNAITCVCGKQFSWNEELAITRNVGQFFEEYPNNTSLICARVLCGEYVMPRSDGCVEELHQSSSSSASSSSSSSSLAIATISSRRPVNANLFELANSWSARHTVEVNRELIKWWGETFRLCPTQACALFQYRLSLAPTQTITGSRDDPIEIVKMVKGAGYAPRREGILSAQKLWLTSHSREVNKATEANKSAVNSLFTTFYPNESLQPIAAIYYNRHGWFDCGYSRCNTLDSSRFQRSVQSCLAEHASPEIIAAAETEIESKQAQQFAHLYGTKTMPLAQLMSELFQFDPKFEYTNRSSIIEVADDAKSIFVRHSAVGFTYPAKIRLPKNGKHRIDLMLKSLPAATTVPPSAIFQPLLMLELENGLDLKRVFLYTARKNTDIKVNVNVDELSASVEWINNEDIVQNTSVRLRQPLSSSPHLSLQVHCGHGFQVRVMSSYDKISSILQVFNREHMKLYDSYIARLSRIAKKENSLDVAKISCLAKKWIKLNNGCMQRCAESYALLQPYIQKLLLTNCKEKTISPTKQGISSKSQRKIIVTSRVQPVGRDSTAPKDHTILSKVPPNITFQSFVYAVCWGRLRSSQVFLSSPTKSPSPSAISPDRPQLQDIAVQAPIRQVSRGGTDRVPRRSMLRPASTVTATSPARVVQPTTANLNASTTIENIEGITPRSENTRLTVRESVFTATTASSRALLASRPTRPTQANIVRTESNRSLQSLSSTSTSAASTSTTISRHSTASARSVRTNSSTGSGIRPTRTSAIRSQHIRSNLMHSQQTPV